MVSLPWFFSIRIAPSLLLPIHVHPSLKLVQQQQNVEDWFTAEKKLELQQMLKPFLSEHLFERFTLHETQKKKKRTSTSSIDLEEDDDQDAGFSMDDYEQQEDDPEESKEYIAILEFLKEEVSTDRTTKIIKGKLLQFSYQFTHTSPHYSMIQRVSSTVKSDSSQEQVIQSFFTSHVSQQSQKEEQEEPSKWKPQHSKYNISKYTLKIYVEELDTLSNAKQITTYFSKK